MVKFIAMRTLKSKNNLESKRPIFFQIGLVTAFALSFAAFEWRTIERSNFDLNGIFIKEEPEEIIPIVSLTTAKPKQLPNPSLENLVKEIEIPKLKTEPIDLDFPEIEIPSFEGKIEPEFVENHPMLILDFVEQFPEFVGGETALMLFLKKNLKFPDRAKHLNETKTVVIQFVITKSGKINQIEALTNHGYGLEEEAIRVVKNMPQWIPGNQNGIPVNVRMQMPVRFANI